MPEVGRFPDDSCLQRGPGAVDAQVAALATRQHGVVASAQLVALGLTQRSISHRAASGRLHRVHRGVYAVGHRVLGVRGRYMAAVLAGGPGAALSHASAAALWELRRSDATRIDVSVRRSGRRSPPGLRLHRPRTLRADEVTMRYGIPVTTPARTLLDVAATLSSRQLERALDQAEIQQLTDYPSLAAMARAHPGHRGARILTEALQRHTAGTTLTKSDLEELFLKLCRDHGLPRPRVNEYAADLEGDFLFEAHGLVVETDSWTYHRTRAAFERDRERDATRTRAGYRTIRFTHRQIAEQPETVAATVSAALRSPATPAPDRLAPRAARSPSPAPPSR
jgi:very-short-patch-repair endonuclease